MSESSYQQWLEIQRRASTSLQNRALKLEESYELIEKVMCVCVYASMCVCGLSPLSKAMNTCYVHRSLNYNELWKGKGMFFFPA